jgi:NAD+ synthase|tara:strand:- start:713 stop:1495 length:783 start_codon:yes stop_codon:yes gene_type:complete
MNRIPDYISLTCDIVSWMCNYCNDNKIKSLVVGVSGGIDSAVSSTLAAKTGLPTYVVGMPIKQNEGQETLSDAHMYWLKENYPNVTILKADLSDVFGKFTETIGKECGMEYVINKMACANSRSRLRMVTLYQIAASVDGIVVGTGNKVEDYGVGFYTKYGDGGVDIAPIADLYKTEVWELGRTFGVIPEIIEAKPTDGLWDDGRTDEDQIGASYEDLEKAMEFGYGPGVEPLEKFKKQNSHKMNPIPTFKLEVKKECVSV